MKCHRLLNPVKGHFSQSCSALFLSPLSFISNSLFHSSSLPSPTHFSCAARVEGRRERERGGDEEEVLFGTAMGGDNGVMKTGGREKIKEEELGH